MKDYKQYNSTVKTVQEVCEQMAGGYHLSESDLRALQLAIEDLQSIYDIRSNPRDTMTATELMQSMNINIVRVK